MLEVLRKSAAALRSNKWLVNLIPEAVDRIIRRRFFTTEYALHLAELSKPLKDAPPESDYQPAHRYRIGIIRDLFFNHESYIAACHELRVAYKTVDLFATDWLRQVRVSGCDAFVAWPSEFITEWKCMYDERLRFLSGHLRKPVYPPYEALWLYGSKGRTHNWLEIQGLPHPKTWVFYLQAEAFDFLETAKLPLVVKLDIGSAAHSVWIVETAREARKLLGRAFGKGLVGRRSDARARQWGHLLFQEYLPNLREWRMIRIGDSYFGHEKGQAGQFHSGSGKVGWFAPPREALELLHRVTETSGFRSMAMDVFESSDGRLHINELQSIFGAFDNAQMHINGVPGRYRRVQNEYVFEEGRFCRNACCNLRIEDLLMIMNNNQTQPIGSISL